MSGDETALDRHLAIEAVRASEAAAIATARLVGRGDEAEADRLAAAGMYAALSRTDVDGVVVIGEGEEGEVPLLYVGQKVGTGKGGRTDVALDPLEGATQAAVGGAGALSVIAFSEPDGLLHVPDVYMDKIAVGGGLPPEVVDIDESPADNIRSLAGAKGCDVSDIVACILNRPRHAELIARVREVGARVRLIADGDVAGIIATTIPESGIDIYLGSGGAQQGVFAAAALYCVGGQMQGRLVLRSDEDRIRARRLGIDDFDRRYDLGELVRGDVIFAATGVTDGSMLTGVRRFGHNVTTHSLVMRAKTGTIRWIRAHRDLMRWPLDIEH
jgi:fructose-1,6-bisphosphatase II / sedoheptulose-1,7-bisphosphatase